ncbi:MULTISPECIES: GRP family sugar transporter [unclassified Exiguobacterium]|uniref:GRP family sugar transporter n=1 Tax=unclassified Exiguobacterium TaxID=2644629 RepID=UPI00103BEF4F|nr:MULTISPECIES: GRP family sugar transporter [unclassified Exiguobacterium]TCI24730.1 glucose transporter GlcU [Exiguobacterium sp. SH5S4]TCI62648.1 glucose transporter GlcU [Exiguobacterium sp. SH3S1]
MEMILLALLPALMWGSIPLIVSIVGGKPIQQLVGTTIGAMVMATVIALVFKPEFTTLAIVTGFISGVFWALGQYLQFQSFQILSVSKAMPISTGMQLVGTSLFGVIVLGDWKTPTELWLGFSALVLIIIGAVMTSYQQHKESDSSSALKKGLLVLLVSSIGYVTYAVLTNYFEVDGITAILPQSLGMFIAALLFSLREKDVKKFDPKTFKNIFAGLAWGIGNFGLFVSSGEVGIATSFALSQLNVVVATLGGIYLLKEEKTSKERVFVFMGIGLIVVAGFMLGLAKS